MTQVFGTAPPPTPSVWDLILGALRVSVVGSSTPKTIKTVTGTINGTTTIVPAVAGRRIKVTAYSLITQAAAANTLTFKSGPGGTGLWTALLFALANTAFGANLAVSAPAFLFGTAAGQALELALSAVQNVVYSVSYFDDDAT